MGRILFRGTKKKETEQVNKQKIPPKTPPKPQEYLTSTEI